MVFHESLNQERKFSLVTPLVLIAILAGTTGVLEVATVLSPQASYAVNSQSQLAQGATPVGADKSECTADSPTGQIDPATKKVKKVGKKCKPAATKGEKIVTVDDGCEPNDYIKAGKCTVTYCSPGGVCAEIRQDSEPKNIPQSTKQLFQMVKNVQTVPESGAEFVGITTNDPRMGTIFAKDLTDEKMMRFERAFSGDFDASIPAPNKGGISAIDEVKGFSGESATPMPGDYQGENPQAINDMLKNNASYLGPTSPGLSQSDLLKEQLSGLNGRYKYGDLTVSTDGKTYTVWKEGQLAATVNNVRDGQTIGDIIAAEQYMSGPESPYEYRRNTFAESVVAQGEVPYSSAPVGSAPPDTSAFDKWSSELPGAMKQSSAYDFSSGALEPGLPTGKWTGYKAEALTDIAERDRLAVASETRTLSEKEYERYQELEKKINPPTEPASGLLKEGERVPLPRPVVRDVSDSLNTDVSKVPRGVDMKIGDGILVTNDGKEIKVTDVASGKTETYVIDENKGLKLADVVQDAQVSNGPYAQEADRLRQEADAIAKVNPERAAALRKEADKIDPRVPVPAPSSGGAEKPGGGDGTKSGGGGDIGKALGSMLEGLMKALGAPKPPAAAPAQACATDQNAYAQQQQQYQSALQQYNYQLQMYNQQQQQASIYGTPAPIAPAQPTPCTPSTGNQCQSQPQQPSASACTSGAWRATYSGACVTGWQCISTEGPKASLSCEPQTADVGSTLAITYGCSSGTASSNSFAVTSQPGGSATTTVANPPAGTNTATYTLACTDNGKTTGAQCSVQVSRANIILVANPKTVPANGTSLLSWLTTGMQSCVISSPDQADFTTRNSSNTSVTGAATTSAITTATSTVMFQLDCKTPSGADKRATTTVSIAS